MSTATMSPVWSGGQVGSIDRAGNVITPTQYASFAIRQVIVQEAPPGWGGGFGPPRHPSPNRGLADLDAELEQFPVDAGRAPRDGLALLMQRIKSRTSVLILGRPGVRDRHRQ